MPFSEEASLLLASSEPPSFAFTAIHGGFSSLLLLRVAKLLTQFELHLSFCLPVGRQVVLHQEKIIKNRLEILKSDRVLAVWGRMMVHNEAAAGKLFNRMG